MMTAGSVLSGLLPPGTKVGGATLGGLLTRSDVTLTYEASGANDEPLLVEEYWPVSIATRVANYGIEPARKWKDAFRAGVQNFHDVGEKLRALPAQPGLAAVRAVEIARHTAYRIIERPAGESLGAVIRDTRKIGSYRQAAQLADELAKALAALHSHGVYLCAITPESIILSPSMRRSAMVAGYGSARVVHADLPKVARTATATEAEAVEPSASADNYAAAALLFEVITGRGAGEVEPDAIFAALKGAQRIRDCPDDFITGIAESLAPDPLARAQSIDAWRKALGLDLPDRKTRPEASPPAKTKVPVETPSKSEGEPMIDTGRKPADDGPAEATPIAETAPTPSSPPPPSRTPPSLPPPLRPPPDLDPERGGSTIGVFAVIAILGWCAILSVVIWSFLNYHPLGDGNAVIVNIDPLPATREQAANGQEPPEGDSTVLNIAAVKPE